MKLLMLGAALATTPAPPRPCLTQADAEAVALVALPEIIRQTGATCAATLPSTSLLRRARSPLLARYDAEADRAWPAARAAIVKLSDPQADVLLGSQLARPLLTTLIAPLIVGQVAVKDCGTIDRLVTLLEPLPPRNVAGVIVTTVRYLQGRGDRKVAALPLCAA